MVKKDCNKCYIDIERVSCGKIAAMILLYPIIAIISIALSVLVFVLSVICSLIPFLNAMFIVGIIESYAVDEYFNRIFESNTGFFTTIKSFKVKGRKS